MRHGPRRALGEGQPRDGPDPARLTEGTSATGTAGDGDAGVGERLDGRAERAAGRPRSGAAATISASISPDSTSSRPASARSPGPPAAPTSTGFDAPAIVGTEARSAAESGAESAGTLSPLTLARVRGEDARAADVGDDAHPPPGRRRLGREQLARLEQLLQGVDPDDPGEVEEGVGRVLVGRERRRVGAPAPPSRRAAPGLQGDDGVERETRRAILAKRRASPKPSR